MTKQIETSISDPSLDSTPNTMQVTSPKKVTTIEEKPWEALEVSETPGLVPPANNGPKILIQSFPQRKNAAPTNPSCTNQLLSACAVQSQLVVSTEKKVDSGSLNWR